MRLGSRIMDEQMEIYYGEKYLVNIISLVMYWFSIYIHVNL